MADAGRPAVFTIPAHRSFADALVQGRRHILAPREAGFEDGTLNYLSIPAVGIGLRHLASIGVENTWLDSRDVIRTDSTFGNAVVDFKTTNQLVANHRLSKLTIAPGFIAADANGHTTTIGRGGSTSWWPTRSSSSGRSSSPPTAALWSAAHPRPCATCSESSPDPHR